MSRIIFLIAVSLSALFINSCAMIFPASDEINSPTDGTAQSGDPSTYEHRN